MPTCPSMALFWIFIHKTSLKPENCSYFQESSDLWTANFSLVSRMKCILFATQSYFHMGVKPYYFMTCAFIPWPVHFFIEYLSWNLGKNLRNTLVISRNFKHNQSHRVMIWARNTLKQNIILIENFQVMKNLPYPMTLIPIRGPISWYSK